MSSCVSFSSSVANVNYAILGEVFGTEETPPLLERIPGIVYSYLSEDEQPVTEDLPYAFKPFYPLRKFVDLTDLDVLNGYLGENADNEDHLIALCEIIERIYEVGMRQIQNGQGMIAFSTPAEVLDYAVELAPDVVLEIAGASGENLIVLGMKAKKAFMNDINSHEVFEFITLINRLPPDMREKFCAIHASCFEILKRQPDLLHRVSLILCNNLIHFFDEQQLKEYFSMVKQILEPGGRIILTVNSLYRARAQHGSEWFEKALHSTTYLTRQWTLFDGIKPSTVLYYEFESYDEAVLGKRDTVSLVVCDKKEGEPWKEKAEWEETAKKIYPLSFQKLEEIKKKSGDLLKSHAEILNKTSSGRIDFKEGYTHAYTMQSLALLLRRHGFHVECTFVVNGIGHLIGGNEQLHLEEKLFDLSSAGVGVIAQL